MSARVVLQFVFELVARAAAPGTGRVAALDHEVLDDAVELGPVVEAFAREETKLLTVFGASCGNRSQTMRPRDVSKVAV
jgi:hypothetical protein